MGGREVEMVHVGNPKLQSNINCLAEIFMASPKEQCQIHEPSVMPMSSSVMAFGITLPRQTITLLLQL